MRSKNSEMKIIKTDVVGRIAKNRAKIEKATNIKILCQDDVVVISGDAEQEYIASQIIEALELGFKLKHALLLAQEDYVLEKVWLKKRKSHKRAVEIRGRLIGTHGRVRRIMEELSDCYIVIKGNTVGIIGPAENVKAAVQAVIAIDEGSKFSSVFYGLEQARAKRKQDYDLGLKR